MYKPKFITSVVDYFLEIKELKEKNKRYKNLINKIVSLVDDEFINSIELRNKLEDLLVNFDFEYLKEEH